MKLAILALFVAISCQSTIAQLNLGDMFGQTVTQIGSAMQSVLNIGKKPSEAVVTTTAISTSVTPAPTAVTATARPSTTGGLGGLLFNNLGNAGQTMGKIAGTAAGATAQGPLNPLNSLSQVGAGPLANLANPTIGSNPLTNLANPTVGSNPLTNLANPTIGANPLTNLESSIGALTNGMSALSQFVNTTTGVLNMLQNQANLLTGIIGQFQNLSSNVFGNFDRIMQQLQNITTALSPDLSGFVPFLPFIREFINATETTVKNVLDNFNNRLISTIRNTANTILNQTNGLQVWATQQRSKLDGSEKKSEGEKIIDDFVNESVTKMQACVKATNKPIQQAYNYTREFVDEASKLGNHVVDQLQDCLGGQKFIFIRILECIQKGTETMSKSTAFIIQEVLPIQNRIASVGLRAAIDWSCLVTEVFSIGSAKPAIEQRINMLLKP